MNALIPAEQVHAALEKILASSQFSTAPRLTRFLRFVVEKTLAGQGAELKEYLLGTEIFDRGSDFDPRLDPIVRVEARRLRAKLDEYYEGSGKDDAVRILLPKGGYAPVFERTAVAAVPRRGVWQWTALAAAVTVIVAGAFLWRNPYASEPLIVAVLPSVEGVSSEFGNGLGEAVSAELSRNSQLRVIAWPLVTEYVAKHPATATRSIVQTARELGATVVLWIPVQRAGDRIRITALLMLPDRGWKEWAGEYERGIGDEFAVQRELARSISDEVARTLPRIR